jgi:hypothetical protein
LAKPFRRVWTLHFRVVSDSRAARTLRPSLLITFTSKRWLQQSILVAELFHPLRVSA